MYNMYEFTKKNVCKYVFIRYLESITQALISAYFRLDRRECKCLEYLFIYLIYYPLLANRPGFARATSAICSIFEIS
jgi:hypothetical protein